MKLSSEVTNWIGNFNPRSLQQNNVPAPAVTISNGADDDEDYEYEEDGEEGAGADGGIVTPEFVTFLEDSNNQNVESSVGIGVNYDSSTDKKLDYNEVCNICLTIARNFRNTNVRDPAIVAIENKRRRDLLNNIARYRRNREIAAVCTEDDLTKLNIEQLETLYAECESKFGQLKLKDASRQGLNILSKAYDMLLPMGIPVGKGKHVSFNGVGDELIKELHNTSTTVGLAYDNFIQKHNIHISDEVSIVTAILAIFVKNIKVTDDSEEAKKAEAKNNSEDDAEEDYDEEEEEEDLVEV
jgi:hypothetical protein